MLTAAHCFRGFEEDRLRFVKLVFGAHKLNGGFVEGIEQVTTDQRMDVQSYTPSYRVTLSRLKGLIAQWHRDHQQMKPKMLQYGKNGMIAKILFAYCSVIFFHPPMPFALHLESKRILFLTSDNVIAIFFN